MSEDSAEQVYYYSPSTKGFYSLLLKVDYEKSSDGWPADAIRVSNEDYLSLLKGQSEGKIITSGSDGYPLLSEPVTDWQARAKSQRQSLLTTANSTTADWRTELQLDAISDDDKARLINWMAYIKALKALDLSGVSDEAGYQAIAWPDRPVTAS